MWALKNVSINKTPKFEHQIINMKAFKTLEKNESIPGFPPSAI